jgi:hypothetical protein
MKTLKFLSIAVLLSCFIGITKTNAQAEIWTGLNNKDVYYEIDGVQYMAIAPLDAKIVFTPSKNWKWVATGEIAEVWENVSGVWVLLDHIPLPKNTVIYYDPNWNDEKVTITPSGKVKVVVLVKDPWWAY